MHVKFLALGTPCISSTMHDCSILLYHSSFQQVLTGYDTEICFWSEIFDYFKNIAHGTFLHSMK